MELSLGHYFFISFIWWQVISAVSITAGIHRYFSHRSFRAPVWYEYCVLIMAPLSGCGSVLGWCGVHRLHHMYSDTKNDPHSPVHRGVWTVLMSTFKIPPIPPKLISDLLKNKRVLWFHKNHRRIRILTLVTGALFLPMPIYLTFIISPIIYGYLGFGLLNVMGHIGSRPRNSFLANILTAGDGWHKNHHEYPDRFSTSEEWWQSDLGGFVIKRVKY
jgi:fatty-acid desaturase